MFAIITLHFDAGKGVVNANPQVPRYIQPYLKGLVQWRKGNRSSSSNQQLLTCIVSIRNNIIMHSGISKKKVKKTALRVRFWVHSELACCIGRGVGKDE